MSEERATTAPASARVYAEVVVFREAAGDTSSLSEFATVPNGEGAGPANLVYLVPGWPGTAETAREVAHEIAVRLAQPASAVGESIDARKLASHEIYTKVVVFRKNEDGTVAFREPALVPNRGAHKPPANRAYYITDFPGDAAAARQLALETAARLAQ